MTRPIMNLAMGVIGALTLAGCAQMQALDRAAGELAQQVKATKGVNARAGAGHSVASSGPVCGQRIEDRLSFEIDIDTAYARLRRHFGYKTLDERKKSNGYGLVDRGFRHETLPGLHYWMKDAVITRTFGPTEKAWMSLKLDRNGSAATDVSLSYCVGGSEGFKFKTQFRMDLNWEIREVVMEGV